MPRDPGIKHLHKTGRAVGRGKSGMGQAGQGRAGTPAQKPANGPADASVSLYFRHCGLQEKHCGSSHCVPAFVPEPSMLLRQEESGLVTGDSDARRRRAVLSSDRTMQRSPSCLGASPADQAVPSLNDAQDQTRTNRGVDDAPAQWTGGGGLWFRLPPRPASQPGGRADSAVPAARQTAAQP